VFSNVGKTTYCNGMQQFTSQIERECAIINLDFANDIIPYIAAIDTRDLITLQVDFFQQLINNNSKKHKLT
jgi:hypothetical protein